MEAAIILGIVSLIGTIVGVSLNNQNNQFIKDTNEDNQLFQEQINEQNHQWSLEAAEWEYEHNKPQRQYADLLAAGITPAAAAQKVSGANVSYSPATAVAPRNMPQSNQILSDSLTQVIDEIGNYTQMSQAQAQADKTRAETNVITETSIKKANAEIEKILADTLVSYSEKNLVDSQTNLNDANTELAQANTGLAHANTGLAQANTGLAQANTDLALANTDLVNEKVATEETTRKSIELTNQEKEIQLEFTRKTLEMSVQKTEAEIKLLSEQTAKLMEEVDGLEFENKYKEWRNTYIETYGVAPEQGWEDTLFKAVIDGKAQPMLDAFSKSLQQVFDTDYSEIKSSFKTRARDFYDRTFLSKVIDRNFGSLKDSYQSYW